MRPKSVAHMHLIVQKNNHPECQTNNKTIKKIHPRLAIEVALNLKKKEININEDFNRFG